MLRPIIFILFSAWLCLSLQGLNAQSRKYQIHVIEKGESLFTIAHKYHTSIELIMRYNDVNDSKPLRIGRKIRIPFKEEESTSLNESRKKRNKEKDVSENASSNDRKHSRKERESKENDALTENKYKNIVYHLVRANESLYTISKKYGVSVSDLREINHLSSSSIHEGQRLTLRKLQDDAAAEPNKSREKKNSMDETSNALVRNKKKTVPVVSETTAVQDESTPKNKRRERRRKAAQQALINRQQNTSAAAFDRPVTDNSLNIAKGSSQTGLSQESSNVENTTSLDNADTRQGQVSNSDTLASAGASSVSSSTIPESGYFSLVFHNGTNSLTGNASIFRTASGWLDRKYYVLINDVPAGTIIKISYSGKSIYAKVLGPLPDIREDKGLLLRISNAAAAVLGITDNRFKVEAFY